MITHLSHVVIDVCGGGGQGMGLGPSTSYDAGPHLLDHDAHAIAAWPAGHVAALLPTFRQPGAATQPRCLPACLPLFAWPGGHAFICSARRACSYLLGQAGMPLFARPGGHAPICSARRACPYLLCQAGSMSQLPCGQLVGGCTGLRV